jgi:hypothetical protein
VHRQQLEAGPFAADVASFRLHLAAENTAAGTVRTYTEAGLWFAARHLLRETGKTRWEQVSAQDVHRWTVRLLDLYSDTYARNQFRALQQFFRWLSAEDGIPDPMGRPPAEGGGQANPVLHQRRTFQAGEGLPGWLVRRPPRCGDHRGVPGDERPAGGAGRDRLPPR